MAVKIRLARAGAKKAPFYRVVAADGRAARDGRFIEILGRYNPRVQPSFVELDLAKVDAWVAKGAQPTEAAAKLIAIVRGEKTVVEAASRPSKKAVAKVEADKKAAEAAAKAKADEKAKEAEEKAAAAAAAAEAPEPEAAEEPVVEAEVEAAPEPAAEEAAPEAAPEPAAEAEAADEPAEEVAADAESDVE